MSAPKTRRKPLPAPGRALAEAEAEVARLRLAKARAEEDARAVREVLGTFARLAVRLTTKPPALETVRALRALALEWAP